MAFIRKRTTKDGVDFYEIAVSRGRDLPRLTTRWYPPNGWSQRSIERELAKVTAAFEEDCKNGNVVTRTEKREIEEKKLQAEMQIKTLKQYCESVFMPELTIRCSENTRSSYQNNLTKWIYPTLGNLKLPDITSAQISALLLSMQTEKKSHSTVVKCYTVLQGVFKKAFMTDVITTNPMLKVERPKPRKDEARRSEVGAYTAGEIRYILECLENEPLKWRTMVKLLIDTGARRGECCALQWQNIDFRKSKITFKDNLCYTAAKGVYLDTSKNRKSRTIDVDPSVILSLSCLRAEQALNGLSKFVFTKDGSCEPMHPQSPTRYLSNFAKKYKIEHLHPHKLRHSFASIAITNGADIASVSEKLGHTDKAVTLRMYTHADEESIKRAGDIFRESIKQA